MKQAYQEATHLLKQGKLSEARRVVVEATSTLFSPLSCVGEPYETMFAGYYFPAGEALRFFRTDFKCVNWVRLDANGVHVEWQSLRGMRSSGKASAQTVFGGLQSKDLAFGKMPSYSGKLAYYEFAPPFRYGVLDASGHPLENHSMDYPEAGKLARAYPVLPSETKK